MNITRHNYEEYFILYMDNELGSEDRHRVELFVQENPDLNEALDWLLQSRLVPDASLVFDNKEQLMKTSGVESINITNYEEWLLLYTDNELTFEQKTAVEKFASDHPAIQEELALLAKTKFEPEQEIIFRHKEVLYRQEEKIRVIAINWRKIAVAAALLIAVSTTGLIILNNKKDEIAIARETPAIKPAIEKPADQPSRITTPTVPEIVDNNNNAANATATLDNPSLPIDKKTNQVKEKNSRSLALPIRENAPVVAGNSFEKKKTNDLPEPRYNPNVNSSIDRDNPIASVNIPATEPLTIPKENIQAPIVTPGNSQSLDNVVTAASIETVDPTDAEPNKKNKLRGFFRKVTRTFEKATNIKATDDEDRLLLGGLAIKL